MSRKVVVKVEKRTIRRAETGHPNLTIRLITTLAGSGDCVARAATKPRRYIQDETRK